MPTALALEYRQRGGGPVHHPAEVHIDHRRPFVGFDCVYPADRGNARIVDEDVEPSEVIDGAIHEAVKVPGASDVCLDGDSAAAARTDKFGDLFNPVLTARS